MGVKNTYGNAHKQDGQSTENPNTDDSLWWGNIEEFVEPCLILTPVGGVQRSYVWFNMSLSLFMSPFFVLNILPRIGVPSGKDTKTQHQFSSTLVLVMPGAHYTIVLVSFTIVTMSYYKDHRGIKSCCVMATLHSCPRSIIATADHKIVGKIRGMARNSRKSVMATEALQPWLTEY